VPEGHTVHRLARDLARDLGVNAVTASSPQQRFAAGADLLDGQVATRCRAYGKHLFVDFEAGDTLHIHLGLIGKFRRTAPDAPRDTVRLRLAVDHIAWDLTGPMTCTVGGPDTFTDVTTTLGPDPLRRDGRLPDFSERVATRRVPIGAALLDQRVVAGIGNVYRAELLFLVGIHPSVPSLMLADAEVNDLWNVATDQLRRGVRLNRIVTVDPADVGASSVGRIGADDRLHVYKRAGEPCRRCGAPIERFVLAGRKTWFCPTCQPPP